MLDKSPLQLHFSLLSTPALRVCSHGAHHLCARVGCNPACIGSPLFQLANQSLRPCTPRLLRQDCPHTHLRPRLPTCALQHAIAAGGQRAAGAHSLDDDFNHDDTQEQQGSDEVQSFGDDEDDASGHAGGQQAAPRVLVEGAAGASTKQQEAALQQGLDLSLVGERQERAEQGGSDDDGFSEEFPDAAPQGAGAGGDDGSDQYADGGDSSDEFADGGLAEEAAPAEERGGDVEAEYELGRGGGDQGADGGSDEFFGLGDDEEEEGGALTTASAHAATEENDEVGFGGGGGGARTRCGKQIAPRLHGSGCPACCPSSKGM